MVIFVAVCCLG